VNTDSKEHDDDFAPDVDGKLMRWTLELLMRTTHKEEDHREVATFNNDHLEGLFDS
jgi:subtilisin-like proprotein convertase family protein